MKTVGALVIVLDPKGRIVQFNSACESTTGYRFEEVQGQPFWDILLVPEEVDPVKAVFADLSSGMFPNTHENYWKTKDGSLRWIAWSNTCLVDSQGVSQFKDWG